jgi:plasmid stability protein
MVALLALAHDRGCEAELAAALEAGLDAGCLPTLDELATRFSRDALAPPPAVSVHLPAVAAYDALLLAGMELTP